MPETMAKTSARDLVTDTLTPQRVFVLSWAFAAIVFGSLGLAAFNFSNGPSSPAEHYAGVTLPPIGPIGSTASIGVNGQDVSMGVLPSRNGRMVTSEGQMEAAQIETLQRELVGLRRRLSMLSEQNLAYSRRIAALEKRIEAPAGAEAVTSNVGPEPVPAIPKDAEPAPETRAPVPEKRPVVVRPATTPAVAVDVVPAPETGLGPFTSLPRLNRPSVPVKNHEPVRIVALPEADDSALSTGSIDPVQDLPTKPDEVQSAATPFLIKPSEAAGKAIGSGKAAVGRTDFGAVVGRYDTALAAAAAWEVFKEENSERMLDLRPVLAPSDLAAGKFDLLVGPFANAAAAAVACLGLLEITDTCHPALFLGDNLPILASNSNEPN
ncbi:MAG: hypothetical protein ABJO05_20075 [Roseibium sp.]